MKVLGSFRDLVQKDGVAGTLPDSLVAYLSASLPDGIKYVLSDDGSCLVAVRDDADSQPLAFRLLSPQYKLSPSGERAFKGIEKSQENVIRYLRNSQEVAYLMPDTRVVCSSGETLPLKHVILPVSAIGSLKNEKIGVEPPEPLVIPLHIGSGDRKWSVTLKQQRNKSVFEERFEGKYKSVSLELRVDRRKEADFELNVTVSPKLSESAQEHYDCLALYNAMQRGEISLDDGQTTLMVKRVVGRQRRQAQEFWKKAAWLEKRLGTEFSINAYFDAETARNVEMLYACWHDRHAVKQPNRVERISGFGILDESNMKPGERRAMISPYRSQLVVFGVKVDASGYNGVFNFDVVHINTSKEQADENGYYPFSIDISCDENTLVSVLYIDDENDGVEATLDYLVEKLSNPIELTPPDESLE